MIDNHIPWVRYLFTGYRADDYGYISHYCFTTINYNPDGRVKISDSNKLEVPCEKLSAFLSANSGATLGTPDFDDKKVRQFSCESHDNSGRDYNKDGLRDSILF